MASLLADVCVCGTDGQTQLVQRQYQLSQYKRFGASIEKTDFEQMDMLNKAENLADSKFVERK